MGGEVEKWEVRPIIKNTHYPGKKHLDTENADK
jgi:hypothetical protein